MLTGSKKHIIIFLIGILAFTGIRNEINAQAYNRVQKLSGYWKFSIGDRQEWALKNYNDSDWDEVYVPSTWEDEGFNGYDGYAWYRKSFTIDKDDINKKLVLKLGRIDDVDQVFLNGVEIGRTGEFPPDFITAWEIERIYLLPEQYLDYDKENVLAVRIYDQQYGGGIYAGEVGIFELDYGLDLYVALDGKWKFSTGDNLEWKNENMNDNSWTKMNVPSRWEYHGFLNYDGYAWYRTSFIWNRNIKDDYVVVMLGKIDDIDEAYLNGELIGMTGGNMMAASIVGINENAWQIIRGYLIPKSKLKKENTLAVRVFDKSGEGGIWEGPVGITSIEEFKDYIGQEKKKGKFFLGF